MTISVNAIKRDGTEDGPKRRGPSTIGGQTVCGATVFVAHDPGEDRIMDSPTARGAAPDSESAGGDAIDMGLLPELIGFNLRCAQVAVFQDFNRDTGGYGISPPQYGTLILVEANPGISQSAIASALRLDRSTLVQIIDRLEARGFVVREVSAHDRRSHALKLTDEGRTAMAELKRVVGAHEDRMTRTLSEEEKKSLISLLARIHRAPPA
jgi:DNA-binding MarR family transcriptional regulator